MRLNSHNEWDKLKEIIVGTAKKTTTVLSWKKNQKLDNKQIVEARKLANDAYPKWFLDEIEEDLNNLSKTIENFGAKVLRPSVYDLQEIYSSPDWYSNSNNIYNTRDLNLVVGNHLIESPSYLRSRYFESSGLYDIWYDNYFDDGFIWIAAPKPLLKEDVLLPYYEKGKEKLTSEDLKYKELTKGRLEILHKLSEKEILFEAANTLRMGKDLLYLVSSSGNEKGAKWLQSVLGSNYKVHITRDIYRSSHIDSTLMCLRPGLVLINSARVNSENCPEIFKKWDKIWFENVAPTSEEELDFQKNVRDPVHKKLNDLGFNNNLSDMSSPWVGMNILSLDQNTVIADERQINLIKELEKYSINVIKVKIRHMYTQGGGIHCATLDTVRDSKLESYFE